MSSYRATSARRMPGGITEEATTTSPVLCMDAVFVNRLVAVGAEEVKEDTGAPFGPNSATVAPEMAR